MTNVRVPATWIAQGHHPRVCARHGEAATAAKPRSFHTKDNPWLLLLLLASPLILVIVSLALRKSVKGPVPTCGRCAREQQRDSSILVGTWVLATVLLTVTIAMFSSRRWVSAAAGKAVHSSPTASSSRAVRSR